MPKHILPPISSLIRIEARSHEKIGGSVNPESTSTHTHHSTPWLSLQTIQYRYNHDPSQTYPRKWDIATRTTKSNSNEPDGVVILAKVRYADDDPRILLVKQFCPPINAVSVELPAGLIDTNESIHMAALRELREETGFTGNVTRVHSPASLSPGMASERVVLVEVEIVGHAQQQQLEPSESIEVISVPINRLQDALQHLVDSEGAVIMHGVSGLAVGIQLASQTSR